MSRRFRPRVLSSILVLIGLIILISLGSWQLNRYFEKTEFESKTAAAKDLPVTVVQSASQIVGQHAMFGRTVQLVGRFEPRRKSHVIKHRIKDGKPGFWLLTPWRFPDDSHVMVNRGWFPFEEGDNFALRAGFPAGAWTGIVHELPHVIADESGRRSECDAYCVWQSVDLVGASKKSDIASTRWLVLADNSATVSPYPIADPTGSQPYLTSDRHLGYVATWYGMAVGLLGLWVAASFGLLGRRS